MPVPTRPPTPDDTIGARDLTAWHTRFGRWLVDVFDALARASSPAARRVARWSSAHLAFVVFAAVALVVMVVLVEGIENEAAHAAVLAIGCSSGQGWYFGKPMEADQAEQLLGRRPSAPVASSGSKGSSQTA